MKAKVLASKIFEIVDLLEENEGLALCASKKRGFENWLKVELCGMLSQYRNVLPEKNHTVNSKKKRIDIVFNDEWAISLKDRRKWFAKGRSNVYSNLNDLKEAPYNLYEKACLVFLTFCPKGKKNIYDNDIERGLKNLNKIYYHKDFNFKHTKFQENNEGRLWWVLG